VRPKVILTLTADAHPNSRVYSLLSTLQDCLNLHGFELIARDGGGTLLFDGRVDFSQFNTCASRLSLDLTLDAKHLISCASSQTTEPRVESAGTSCTEKNLRPADDPIWAEFPNGNHQGATQFQKDIAASARFPSQGSRPCPCWKTGDFIRSPECEMHSGLPRR
jgi:hypothetical protein